MKSYICACVAASSLLLATSSCSDHSTSRVKSAQEQHLTDSQIINIIMTIDKGEIAISEEALKKQTTPTVETYANYLIQQHKKNLDRLIELDKQLNLQPEDSTISNSIAMEGKHDLKTLNDLQGKDFDKAFINAMIKGHQGGLHLIDTKLLPETKNPQLRTFVEQFRKMVQEHLEKALTIQGTF